jgi:hypothetical protein
MLDIDVARFARLVAVGATFELTSALPPMGTELRECRGCGFGANASFCAAKRRRYSITAAARSNVAQRMTFSERTCLSWQRPAGRLREEWSDG